MKTALAIGLVIGGLVVAVATINTGWHWLGFGMLLAGVGLLASDFLSATIFMRRTRRKQ